jgi:acetoin utilization deacetylase AcuC-like enzyme
VLPFRLVYHRGFNVDLGPHVFPSRKYAELRQLLLESGVAEEADFVAPEPASDAELLRVHTPEYLRKLESGDFSEAEALALEVPWSRELVTAFRLAAGAAALAGRLARAERCCIAVCGGFHHAFPDHGEGFCLLHDVAIAVRGLRDAGEAQRVAIVDLDVHHGNGTAAIFADDPDVFSVSLHQQHNYPAFKPPSTLDVGLPDRTGDEAYLEALAEPLRRALEFRPQLLFYLAGADPYEQDRLGGLGLSLEGLKERDRRVFDAARQAGVPVAVTLAGGYAARPADTVAIHRNTVLAAATVFGR